MQVKKSLREKGEHIRTQPRAPVGAIPVKKGDIVEVLAGDDAGKTGEVKEALPREGRVVIEGVNLHWRHRKPTQKTPKGERVQQELPIHASNVRLAEGPSKTRKAAPAAKSAAEPKAAGAKPAKPKASKKKS